MLLLTAFAVPVSGQLAWKQKADFPGDGRSSSSSFSFSDYGFIGLGYDGADFRRSFYAYDPVYNSWTAVSSMGGPVGEGLERNVAASFTIGTKGYAGTGQGGSPFLNDFWEYNYLTDVWTIKSAFAGTSRRCAVGFSINGKGYIGLGQDATGYKKDLWEYDTTTNTWTQKADFGGTARRLAAAFSLNNKAYVGTGDDGAFTKDFWEYDQPSNSWFLRDEFPGSPRYGATGFALNGKGYVVCGYDTTLANRNDFWEYDPPTDTWTPMPDFPGSKRANAVAFTVDTLAFFGMGYDTSFYYDVWLWGDTTAILPPDTSDAILNTAMPDISISVYPNPVFENALIEYAGAYDASVQYSIFDMNGNDVTDRCEILIVHTNAESTTLNFAINNLQAGAYFFAVRNKQFSATKKFLIFD